MAIEVTPPSPAVSTKLTTSQDGPMFSLRIVNLEYYMSPPLPGMDVGYSKFQGRTVAEVPVVRIYGSTPAGQKACLHLHQVFPYFYVPYDDDLPQDISDALAYVRSLASAIEKAMKLASSNAAKKQHVHSCSLVRARRYYGYYPSEQLFVKIVLYHPQEVARISTLLLGGGIMNRKFQPHESHVSYLLQLLIDQNLAGMSYIHLSSVKFRRPIPERPSDTLHVIQQLKAEFTPTGTPNQTCAMETTPPSAEWRRHTWVESSIPAHWVWPSNSSTNDPFGRHSTCELEVDAIVEDILNRQELVFVPLHEAGPAIKLVQSLTPMWEEERLRTGEQGPAGAAAALRPSPDRFLPPPSALEQALRDSLFQIVQDEEQFKTKSEEKQVQKSTQEMLLGCSQAANVVRSEAEEPRLDSKSIGVQGSWPEDGSSGQSQCSEEELVNEQIIRSQLTPPGLASQEAEDEVAELLEWMGASPDHGEDDEEEEALEIRQTWDSPTMEAAMLQAVSKFEKATQKECQEILDCVNNNEDDDDDAGGEEDLEAALLEIDLEDMARGRYQIPQNDGADDDETEPDPKRMRVQGSKKDVPKRRPVWGLLPVVGASSQPTNVKQEKKVQLEAARPRPRKETSQALIRGQEEKSRESEVSLRALMRRKRERRRKESSVSGGSSSIPESQSEGEQSFGVVRSESSLPEESESQEQQNVALSGLWKLVDDDPVEKLPSKVSDARSSEQGVETGAVYPVEDVVDYNLHETGDHRDCGGGGGDRLHLLLTQPKAGVVENVELAQVASFSWAEVVKEVISAKVSLHAHSGFKDALDLLPAEAHCEDEHVVETQLVEHEIFRRLKMDEVASVTEEPAGEDDFIGTILVEDFVSDKTERSFHEEIEDSPPVHIKDSPHEGIEDSPSEQIKDSPHEGIEGSPHEGIEDSPPKIRNSDAAPNKEGLLFTDMSDVSEDSFDWGDEFGSSHRLDESDEGAYASQEDNMPDVSVGVKLDQPNESPPALAHLNMIEAPEAAEEMFSSKSSSQTKLGGRMSNLSSGTDQIEDESEAAPHNAISEKSEEFSEQELITIPVKFCQKPPSRDALMATLEQHNLREVDYGGVFYGNAKDVPARATVSAGLLFDVKSREPQDLPPFLFGAENKKSRFSIKAKPADLTPGIGIPCHYENDGSVSYLLTPAKPPPSRISVQKWLSENQSVTEHQRHSRVGERVFTMDANTGKLVPIDEAGSNRTTQQEEEEEVEYFRPASPKYDEKHVLATPTASPAYARSSKRRSSSAADATPLFSSGATTSSDVVSKPKLLQASSQDEKNVDCTPPQLPKEDEVKVELPTDKPKDIPKSAASRWRDVSQITAPSPLKGQLTPLSQSGFRDPASVGAGQQITLMSIEVHSETRGNLLPDPRYDAVGMVVVDIQYDDETCGHLNNQTLVLLVDSKAASSSKNVDGVRDCSIIYLTDELLLLKCFVRLVRLCDPDMLVGWEVQGSSLGLLAERAANLGFGLLKELSRTPPKTSEKPDDEKLVQELRNSVLVSDSVITDEWGRTNGSGLFVGGRIILNLWRIMRGEVKLGIYTLEAVAEAVLRRRVPRIPWRTLTRWFSRGLRYRCIEYFVDRAKLNFEIMGQLDLLNRTAELARVFGIDFYSVFSRGSQYRVESMMLRLAHTQNFLLLSPSRQQVAAQPAMECLPLVMEPESRFYTSPVVVLDFQSLYPSMIIAYNLCYSTCLGKLVSNNPKVLGVANLPIPPGLLHELKDLLTITPNGVMYTPPEVRQGVVPRLLSEILSTRIMVKQAMKKLTPDQRVLQRVLNARQFALKLIANVTYGYTAAGFSGRMPCAELADSIVQCGRLTLERAIHLVNTTKRWDARVVYGDTDSMFVHLEGRTREEAFRIGQDIAASVTAMNPNPVTLKMEKVYHPCVLLTKKRYVGYSFESPGQATPTFDAKGIETIRRDSCVAVAKTLERSLRTLFETQDLSQVKAYLQRQWGKIVSGRVSLRDFVFAKEVRLGTYSARASVLPAAAIVASKAMSLDPRAEPRYAERVPYVVVHGEPGARLSDVVVDPHTMLANNLRLHDTYYITKQIIPALQRVLGLVGADLRQWYAELPRVYRPPTTKRHHPGKKSIVEKGATIDHYYLSQHCSVCGELMRGSQVVCSSCSAHPQAVVSVLTTQTARLEMEFKHLEAICRHCGGGDGRPEGHIACVSLDCPIFFERLKVHKELQALSTVSASCGYYPTCFLDFGSELF